jgi:hypothetical protein
MAVLLLLLLLSCGEFVLISAAVGVKISKV